MIRSGDEPAHARSPLGLRLALALVGLVFGVAGAIGFAFADAPPLAWLFGVVAVLAAVDVVVVARHLRAGPHYQPGRDVPPYRPVDDVPTPRPPRTPSSPRRRMHRYFALMGLCLTLLLVAWIWVRLFNTGLAVAMTLVAMVIPPIAAIVANLGANPPER